MDDPTRWCENDTGNETRSLGPRIPSRGPYFLHDLPPSTILRIANCC